MHSPYVSSLPHLWNGRFCKHGEKPKSVEGQNYLPALLNMHLQFSSFLIFIYNVHITSQWHSSIFVMLAHCFVFQPQSGFVPSISSCSQFFRSLSTTGNMCCATTVCFVCSVEESNHIILIVHMCTFLGQGDCRIMCAVLAVHGITQPRIFFNSSEACCVCCSTCQHHSCVQQMCTAVCFIFSL